MGQLNAGRSLSNPGEIICKTNVRLRQEFLEKYHRIADACFPIRVVLVFVRTIADPANHQMPRVA